MARSAGTGLSTVESWVFPELFFIRGIAMRKRGRLWLALTSSLAISFVSAGGSFAASSAGTSALIASSVSPQNQMQAAELFNDAIRSVNKNDYAAAVDKLKRATTLDPNLANAWGALGECQANLGQFEEGIANLKKCTQMDPSVSTAWSSLASVCATHGHLPEAIEAYTQFTKRFPNDPITPKAKALIGDLRREMAQQGAVKEDEQTSDNYLKHANVQGTYRWKKEMPLKVFLADPGHINNYLPVYRDKFVLAMQRWQQASDGAISFVLTDNKDNSDIDVFWTDNLGALHSIAEGGDAKPTVLGSELKHVRICLSTIGEVRNPVTEKSMYLTSLHELGHALGIEGHSDNPGDIMFYTLSTAADVSSRDANTLRKLYKADIALSPQELNNQAAKLISSGRDEEAIPILEKCVSMGFAYSKKNMAIAYNNIALRKYNSGAKQDAEDLLKKALDVLSDSDPTERISLMENYITVLSNNNKTAEAEQMQNALAALRKK